MIAEHIEVSDADLDDAWLPAERYEELISETAEVASANVQRIIESERLEAGDVSAERVSLIRRIMFMVDDVDDVVNRLRNHGAELVGEIAQYEDIYRLCFVRGPEGVIIGLSEQLS